MSDVVILKDEIYSAYKEKVTAYVRSHISDPYMAEDIVSEVFLKVYRNLEGFDESRASLSTWIYSITRNTVIDYYKKREAQRALFDEITEFEEMPDESPAYEGRLEDLANALENLSERERDLIILHYYKGYTLKRIAVMTGISYINAKVIHAKALAALRKLLN